MDFFAIRPEPSLVAAVGPLGQTWYEAEGDWEAYDSVTVDVSADATSVDVTTVDATNGEQMATVPLDGVQAQIDQQVGDVQLITIMPSSADLGFIAAVAMALATQQDAADEDNAATDAVFEMMGV